MTASYSWFAHMTLAMSEDMQQAGLVGEWVVRHVAALNAAPRHRGPGTTASEVSVRQAGTAHNEDTMKGVDGCLRSRITALTRTRVAMEGISCDTVRAQQW